MVRYLLGLLPEIEQQWLEADISADEKLCEELLAVEHELMDDYLEGQLSKTERERFESYFLRSRERQRKLAIAEALKIYAADPKHHAPSRRGWWRRIIASLFGGS